MSGGSVRGSSLCLPHGHQLKHQGDLGELWGGSVTPAAAHPSARDGWRFSACATKTCSVRSTPLDFRWSQLALPAKINSQLRLILCFVSVPLLVAGGVTSRRTSAPPACGGALCPTALGFVSWAPWPFFLFSSPENRFFQSLKLFGG